MLQLVWMKGWIRVLNRSSDNIFETLQAGKPIVPPRHKHAKGGGNNIAPTQRNAVYEPYSSSTSDSHIYETVDIKVPEASLNNNYDRSSNFSENFSESNQQTAEGTPGISEINQFLPGDDLGKQGDKKDTPKPHLESLFPGASVHKDYHVSPQKLNQQLTWPPPRSQAPPSPGVLSKALTFVAKSKIAAKRRKANAEQDRKTADNESRDQEITSVTPASTIQSSHKLSEKQSSSRPLIVNSVAKPYTAGDQVCPTSKYSGGKSFVSNLPRIQENIPSEKQLGSLSSLGSLRSGSSTPTNTFFSGSQGSITSPAIRSIPLAWVGDNDRIKNLQIVSKRAKKFENLDSTKPPKSSLQRLELPRLSQRTNFAQRKQEFEKMDSAPVGKYQWISLSYVLRKQDHLVYLTRNGS